MKKGTDIIKKFDELMVIHHNLPGKKVEMPNKSVHHLIIPISGQVKVETNDNTFKFGPSKMIYVPCGYPHIFECSSKSSGERLVAIIEDKFFKKVSNKSFTPTLMNTNTLVKELLLFLLLQSKVSKRVALVETLIGVMEDSLVNVGSQKHKLNHLYAKTSDERLITALNYIADHDKETLVIGELAKVSGMSSRNLNRLFSEAFGVNPKQLHNQQRIYKSLELLKNKQVSVTDVCFEVGYSSLSQFIKSFKKVTGKLPSEI